MVDIHFPALSLRETAPLRLCWRLLVTAWQLLAARRRRRRSDLPRWDRHKLRDIGVTPTDLQYVACHGRLPPHRVRRRNATSVSGKRPYP